MGNFLRRFQIAVLLFASMSLNAPIARAEQGASGESPGAVAAPPGTGLLHFLEGRKFTETNGLYDPEEFFQRHFFGYEPFYFIAGTESPNAKFQISFKYRLLNEDGRLAEKARWLTGFYLAYSQTSLWDWKADSAPFFDSSYRPEFLYSWDKLAGGGEDDWLQFDIQGGFQHESNGRRADDSRNLNILHLRPRITFGKDAGPQVSLTPRVWSYVGSLGDNPDIARYRGYADLRVAFGWKRGFQISALGKIGNRADRGSVQVDVTYPLMHPLRGSFSIYLHAQYFTGYGESLIAYRERTEVFRVGISLYR